MSRGKNSNMIKILLLGIVLVILIPQNVLALGIGPARFEYDFEPGLRGTETIYVFNDDSTEEVVDLYVDGDLAEYVTLSTTTLTIPPKNNRFFTFSFTLPGTAPGEGKLDTRIGAVQTVARGEGNAVAKLAVEAQFWVYAPFEGKKLQTTLQASDVKPGDDVEFILGIENVGSEVVEGDPSITISKDDEDVATIDLDPLTIQTRQEVELRETYPSTNLEDGTYTAVASVVYDGDTATAEDTFSVGGFIVRINDITHDPITRGTVARFDVEIESLWTQTIDGVYIVADVFSEDNVGSFTSQTTFLSAGEKKTIPMYWDTKDIVSGEYFIRFTLHYGDKTDVKDIDVVVGESLGFNLIIIIILIVILGGLLFLFWERKRKKRKNFLKTKK